METLNTPAPSGPATDGSASTPPCARCASADTEPVVTMRRQTVEAEPWYRCEECGHVFARSDGD